VVLCLAVWGTAAFGIAIKLFLPRRLERLGLALYLATGWMLLPVIGPMVDALPALVLWLLLTGGVVYTLGTMVHLARRLAFHNALWHAMVLTAAALHFAAVAVAFA
jgi:hemolysin III